MIRVQREDFDLGAEMAQMQAGRTDIGGIASFVGLVRGKAGDALTLEHYPGMAERQMTGLEAEARRRWPIIDVTMIHRVGRLTAGERIVLVAVTAAHREAAFAAAEFLMDWLKTKAPFWKLEERGGTARWVDAEERDAARALRWD